ncbi:acyltransferase family protein [Nocardiopsis sediminis]|uniref:Acyltransferase family protein n=1 Tax=Nocardiopsis sediminis TaxID=1778267 RepID=A0ABV8FFJ4_9ACTN
MTAAPAATARPPGPSPASPGSAAPGHRPEIQGLRAVAVLLVAVYHIWLGRVSGGVDVFLMLTGFLITGSLVRMVERRGRVDAVAFLTRLAKRLLPGLAVVLGAVLVATYLFLPADRWRDTIAEVIASALYFENWRLALDSVDYLAQDTESSPVQHVWSLSIQGQFYLVWVVLMAAVAWVAARRGWPVRRVALGGLAAVFTVSLGYSVVTTATQQQWAYFDTGTRLWEFALGGILALALPYLRLPRVLRTLLGWAGLAALVSCGLLLQVSTMFPGYIALWPTLAAALVIVAGTTGSPIGADRLLSWKPLHYIGDISYALYLWHWPVLVCYLAVTDRTTPSLLGGGYILALSLVLAAATTRLTDGGADLLARGRGTPVRSLAVGLAFLLPVLMGAGAWTAKLDADQREREAFIADPANYPGAAVLADGATGAAARELPVAPQPAEAADDVPSTYADGCNQGIDSSEVLTCTFGSDTPERTIALVGGSHAAHWYPALERIAESADWRIVNIIKGACLFTDLEQTYKGNPYTACADWNDGVMAELEELRPDAVFTTATSSSIDTEAGFGGEVVVDGYLDRWRELGDMGIDVIAVRDTPRLGFDTAECVATKGAAECSGTRAESMAATSPLEGLAGVPANVSLLDLNDLVCPDEQCPAVVGNVLVYWDGSHFTTTYMRTLAPALEERIRASTGW